jgi:sporulation protein YlmC with PRC-barrel domain
MPALTARDVAVNSRANHALWLRRRKAVPEREIDMTGVDAPIETVGDAELIASDRVEGTAVYGPDGEKIGHVHNFMVNKRTGQVAHVIISDGGFFGLGGSHYIRAPWTELAYDPAHGGYVSQITKSVMSEQGRPSADEVEMTIW